VGITFIFVTHDQQEALTMSDRIAVFERGRIAQVGEPRDIYERPATGFVAGFVGTSNLFDGPLSEQLLGRSGRYLIRPEKFRLLPADASAGDGMAHTPGMVTEVQYLGWETRIHVHLDAGVDIITSTPNDDVDGGPERQRGDRVVVAWDPRHVVAVAPDVDGDPEPARAGAEFESASSPPGGTS
jgi:putative spermidine/putrescine transport system ATP-binding protein